MRFDSLQIFRGWAALLVVLCHASFACARAFKHSLLDMYFAMGNAGVDFFFVLSGFIIFYFNVDDIGRRERFKSYVEKRLIRVVPVYWLVTLAILPVYFLVPSFGEGNETQPFVIFGSLALLPMERAPILVAGWTLRHEMLFYFFFALLIARGGRWARALVAIWIVGVIASVALSFDRAASFSSPVLRVLFWPQNSEFVLGCAAAYVVAKANVARVKPWLCMLVVVLGVVAFGLAGFLPEEFTDLKFGKHSAVYGSISAAIVVAATLLDRARHANGPVRRNVVFKGMLFLGDASYSIYLVHGPALSATVKVFAALGVARVVGGAVATWAVVAVAVAVGCVFHVVVEKPLLAWFRRKMATKRPAVRAARPLEVPTSETP